MDDAEINENALIPVAMQIILHAGDARNYLTDALHSAENSDFDKADLMIQKAEFEITNAHKSQTTVIQNEASGKEYGYSILFTHAQDTLMTINSELRLTKEMIEILKIINKRGNLKV